MAFFPALAQRYMRRITGNDEIAFGHFGTLGYVLSGWIGSVCGKGSRSTEESGSTRRSKLALCATYHSLP